MNYRRLVIGVLLVLFGGLFIWEGYTLHGGDGMFGRLPEKTALAVLGVIMFVPGVVQIVRGLAKS